MKKLLTHLLRKSQHVRIFAPLLFGVIFCPVYSYADSRKKALEEGMEFFKGYVAFLDSPQSIELPVGNISTLAIEDIGSVILESKPGDGSLCLLTRLSDPFEYFQYYSQDGALKIYGTERTFNDRVSLTHLGESISPADYITVVISVPSIENLVIGNRVGEVYGESFSNEYVLNCVVSSDGKCVFENLTCNQINLVNSGDGSIFLGNIDSPVFSIVVSGDGTISAESIESARLSIVNNGSGSVIISSLKANEAHFVLNDSGDLDVSGTVWVGNYVTSGSGILDLYDLKANTVSAVARGNGIVNCHASTELNAVTESGGRIYYSGHPVNINRRGNNISAAQD